MAYKNADAVVSTDWLAAHLDAPNVRVVDASFTMPGVTPTAPREYASRHIPGAIFFDIETVADPENPLPHMLPSAEAFAATMAEMGLSDEDRIVVYDMTGLLSAPRVWWMLRLYGHRNVALLDGGLPKWLAENRPVTALVPKPRRGRFTARLAAERVRDKAQLLANLDSRAEQVIDARSAPRFAGSVAEPRPGLRAGHIPGSLNLPSDRLSDPATRAILPAAEIERRFRVAGLAPDRPVITSCGSGVSACVLSFGLHLLGWPESAVYDGSWSEWGLPGDTPVETT